MGIIIKQTIKGSLISYFGILLGFVTTGLLMPHILQPGEIGLLNLLISYSALFATLSNLGIVNICSRMFPFFRNKEKGHNGFLSLAIIINILGFLLTILLFYTLQDYILKDSADKSPILNEYFYYIIPLFLFTQFFNVFDVYYRVLYDAVISTFFKEVIQRILILVSILLFNYQIINFSLFVTLYCVSVCLPTVFLIISLIIDGEFFLKTNFKFLNRDLIKTILSVGFYGTITSISGIIIYNIDTIMVNSFRGVAETGVYSIAFFFGTIVILPSRMLKKIATTILSDSWKDKNMDNVLRIYKGSTINQLIIGIFLFLIVWVNIENVFKILPESYQAGRWVIFFISLANVVEMLGGVNVNIITVSQYYRANAVFVIILIFFQILFNYLLLPILGITGAAISTLIAMTVYNLCQFIFLKVKFNMQPYSFNHFKVLIIGLISYFTSFYLPEIDFFLFDITYRSVIFSILFIGSIYFLKISDEFNSQVLKYLNKIFLSK